MCLTVPPVGILIGWEWVGEANLLSTRHAVCMSAFVGSPLQGCVPYSQNLMSFLQVWHWSTMSLNSVWINSGAALSCGAVIAVSWKQHGHLTPLQLNTLNHSTIQAVHTSALHGSSRGWCKIFRHMGHCNCSRIAGLLELLSTWESSKDSEGGAIARMPAMIFCGLCVAGRPQGCAVLSLSGLGWQIWM